MPVRFRVVLPVSLGAVAVALMIWDLHNQRVIDAHGFAWDTGAPAWPYQTSSLLFQVINAPALVLAAPFFLLPHLDMVEVRYPVQLPLILLWWWWVGTRIDFGILGDRHYRRPKLLAALLATAAAGLLFAGVQALGDGFRWWSDYPPARLPLLAGDVFLALWCLALATGSSFGALRLLRRRFPSMPEQRHERPILAYGFAFTTVIAVTISLIGTARDPKSDPNSCAASEDKGCLHGTMADENGRPLKGIEVEILWADKTGEARWRSKKSEWTDNKGRFSVNGLEPGEYLVAVYYYGAPDAHHPFASIFYPGVEAEGEAERVLVRPNSRAFLKQLCLRPLPLATIKVEVIWPDGTRPKRSNLLFHNLSYPSQAVIGDVAPQIENGTGEFTLPEGFDYTAAAQVDCDAGKVVESRESRPVHKIRVGGTTTPRELTFVIPGPPCTLWRPK